MNIIETNLKFKNLTYGNTHEKIVYHHAEHSTGTVYDVHQWHLNFGWSGIGYHFYVTKDGKIYRGRPENAVGAHTVGHNSTGIGICAQGSYMKENMPQAQKRALIELGIYLKNKYNINQVYGHGELNSTNCPGSKFPLKEIKESVLNNKTINSFIKVDGGSKIIDGKVAINLIIRDFSKDVVSVFGYVDSEKSASWAFSINPANSNYAKLEKNCNKAITSRASGNVFKSGVWYKITVKGYNSSGEHVSTAVLPLQGIQQLPQSPSVMYTVQCGAFQNKKYAEELLQKLKNKGFKDSFIKEVVK